MASQNSQSASVLVSKPSDGTEMLQSWVNEAPLKLVASVLCGLPEHSGRRGDIQKVLQTWDVELTPKWDGWWKRVRRMLTDSEHFGEGKGGRFTLLHNVDDIPPEPLRPVVNSTKAKAPKKKRVPRERPPPKLEREWLSWFQGETEGPPPTRGRTKEAVNAIDKCDAVAAGRALRRMTQCSDVSGSTKQAAASWAKLVSQAALRQRAGWGSYADDDLAESVGATLGNLINAAGFPGESGRWLFQAGISSNTQPEAWPQGLASGIWQAIDDSDGDARQWLRKLMNRPGADHQTNLVIAQEMVLSAFNVNGPAKRYAQLDGLLALLDGDASAVIQRLIIQAAAGKADRNQVAQFINHKHNRLNSSERAQELSPLALTTLLLTDGMGPLATVASQGIAEVLLDGSSAYANDHVWNNLLAEGRERVADMRASLIDELNEQRQRYEDELAERRQEEERLNQTVQRLRAEIAAGREVARMDILQDILTVITETLQSLRSRQNSPEQMLRRVEANLTLALRAGGAEEFGTVDDTVPYDPIRHQAEQYVSSGSPVRITFPGAIIPGKVAGDRVLLKAAVVASAEVN